VNGGAPPVTACDARRVTPDAAARLHLVHDNTVAPVPPTPARQVRPVVLVTVGAGLTVVLALLGRQPWQLPVRDGGGMLDVPQSLVSFLLICAVLCTWLAGRLARPAETLRSSGARYTWWALATGAAVVSLAGDLSLASYAGTGEEPGDLALRCAVSVVPAVLAGILASEDGRAARVRLALGTGLVTVPLGALGWALLSSAAGASVGLGDVLAMTGLSAAAPLALAVTFVAADRRSRLPG